MADEPIQRIKQSQRLSEQQMQNYGFDSDFEIPAVEIIGHYNGTDTLLRIQVDEHGKLLISNAGTSSVWEYSEVTSVPSAAVTTIHTHTVTSTKLFLDIILASGNLDAEYLIVVNGSTKARYKTSEQDRTAKFLFPSAQRFEIGDIIDIKVLHDASTSGDFNASLIGHK